MSEADPASAPFGSENNDSSDFQETITHNAVDVELEKKLKSQDSTKRQFLRRSIIGRF